MRDSIARRLKSFDLLGMFSFSFSAYFSRSSIEHARLLDAAADAKNAEQGGFGHTRTSVLAAPNSAANALAG
jgi:hypothetical protein